MLLLLLLLLMMMMNFFLSIQLAHLRTFVCISFRYVVHFRNETKNSQRPLSPKGDISGCVSIELPALKIPPGHPRNSIFKAPFITDFRSLGPGPFKMGNVKYIHPTKGGTTPTIPLGKKTHRKTLKPKKQHKVQPHPFDDTQKDPKPLPGCCIQVM